MKSGMDPIALLQELVEAYGPPGQEAEVRSVMARKVAELGYSCETDAKGNLIVKLDVGAPKVVVTAHLDEIAMMVKQVGDDGALEVTRLGGIHAWKLGEGPVDILGTYGTVPGILGFGGIHTEDPAAASVKAREKAVGWEHVRVFTGLTTDDLRRAGVRPGTRVVVHRSRRRLTHLGDHVACHFLDDRADLVAMLLMLERLKGRKLPVWFVASAAEEVGGEGALYLLQSVRPEICLALELGANVPDAPVAITAAPTVWAIDGYAATSARDLDLLSSLQDDLQFQAFSRGGSDASCAASHGLCARPVTLGLPMENSHGYEVMHTGAMDALAELGCAYLDAVLAENA